MYAFGATPESVSAPTWMPCTPAAIPATWVAWNEPVGSNGVDAYFHVGDGGVNVRWTITFGVANCVCPFGKPGGYWNPFELKYGWPASTPSSMIPIFIPLPAVSKLGPHSLSAPICCGPSFTAREWYRTFGQTSATPVTGARWEISERGRTTASPFAASL